jgi:hypothetical protein
LQPKRSPDCWSFTIERIRAAIQARTEECRDAGSEAQLLREVRQTYSGEVVAGHDLDI